MKINLNKNLSDILDIDKIEKLKELEEKVSYIYL